MHGTGGEGGGAGGEGEWPIQKSRKTRKLGQMLVMKFFRKHVKFRLFFCNSVIRTLSFDQPERIDPYA